MIYYFATTGQTGILIGAALAFVLFFLAGWYDAVLKKEMKRYAALIRINQQELDAISGNYKVFEPGTSYIDEENPYTFDLDIFGEQSLFQYVNRTVTRFGNRKLADYFLHAFSYHEDILSRQEAIQELSNELEFRQQLQLVFFNLPTSLTDISELITWLNGPNAIQRANLIRWLAVAFSLFTISMLTCSIAGSVSYQIPVMLILMQLLMVYAFGRRTMKVHNQVTNHFRIINLYSRYLAFIEQKNFTGTYLHGLKTGLQSDRGEMPGRVIKRLSIILNWMDMNLNIVVAVILNGLFLFNLHMLVSVERWRGKYRDLVPGWFGILGELDALGSLATFSFNHPDYLYPEPVGEPFLLVAEGIGHPLIPAGRCVTNSLEIRGWKQFRIITGANMSGKSTFLRTVGVNYILAMLGAPVFADRMVFTPVEVYSSIRTNDSLVKRESYFYAELKRLKKIIDELEGGKRFLILLDEILKGTNSKDKQTGSIALIRQFMNYSLVGLFATHDLSLGSLIEHYPGNIQNLCFEISILKDRMDIDYKLLSGVCKNLNASYLMKQMGILIDRANEEG